MDNLKDKIKVLFIGFLFIFLLIEVTLRFIGFGYSKSTYSGRKITIDKAYTILCLGDSYTVGAGAPTGGSYPCQLEHLLNSSLKDKKVIVINAGVSAQNTTQLLDDLQHNLDTFNPNLIIIMTGGSNYWNLFGYQKYMKKKSFASVLYDKLYRIRTFKLIKLLWLNVKEASSRSQSVQKFGINLENNSFAEDIEQSDVSDNTNQAIISNREKARRWKENPKVSFLDSNTQRNVYQKQGEYSETMKCFKDAMSREPNKISKYYCDLGWAYDKEGNYEEAVRYFKEGIKVNPSDGGNYHGIGCLYREQGNYAEALRWFNEGINVAPKDGRIYNGMGMTYKEQGNYTEALRWYMKGVEVDPSVSSNYHGVGYIYRGQGEYEEALQWFRKGIEVDPSDSFNYNGIGWVYADQNNYNEALKWFKEAIKRNPNDRTIYDGIHLFYQKQDRYEEIADFFADLKQDNSDLANYIKIFQKKDNIDQEITNWITNDIERVIKICTEKGIAVILQSYPIGQRASFVLEQIARKHSLPFVDNYSIFQKMILANGDNMNDYFVPDGHCNSKGYGVMADNISDKMREAKLIDF